MRRTTHALWLALALTACGAELPPESTLPNPLRAGVVRENLAATEDGVVELAHGLPVGALPDRARLVRLDASEACFALRISDLEGAPAWQRDPLASLSLAAAPPPRPFFERWRYRLDADSSRDVATRPTITPVGQEHVARVYGEDPVPGGASVSNGPRCNSLGGPLENRGRAARMQSRPFGTCGEHAVEEFDHTPVPYDVRRRTAVVCLDHHGAIGPTTRSLALEMIRDDAPSDWLRWEWAFTR